MATNQSPPANPPANPKKVVVVAPVLKHDSINIVWAMLAGVVSVVAHLLLIFLIMNINLGDAQAESAGEIKAASEAKLDEEKQEAELDLTNIDIGNESLAK